MKFRRWACTVLVLAIIVGMNLATEVQSTVVYQDTVAEEIAEVVPEEGESGGAVERDEPGENAAPEIGEEPMLE
ncbi:MAG: hypothetical protein GTO24_05630, partial [candidate division Zixibacteria bacterium]|nr:hypothetical protein [candidate division Zixibacteria bacterium]